MKHFEKQVTRETLYQGGIFSVHRDKVQLESGGYTIRDVVEHNGGVAVLALDGSGNVLLVRQFRYGVGQELLELPAGKLNLGEDPQECGLRELQEETGYRASSCELLLRMYPTPAYVSEQISIYKAEGLEYQGQHLDEDEFLSVEKVPFDVAVQMCLDGSIRDGKTIAGILSYHSKICNK